MDKKPQTIEELMNYYDSKISSLEAELARVREERDFFEQQCMTPVEGNTLLNTGSEQDLYPGELHEVLLSVLKDARDRLPDVGRRTDIIEDLLRHNPVKGLPEKRSKELKTILKGYKRMDSVTQKKLKEMGIEIQEQNNKHYKFRYYGDRRYTEMIAATGSDGICGGRNAAAFMIKKFF